MNLAVKAPFTPIPSTRSAARLFRGIVFAMAATVALTGGSGCSKKYRAEVISAGLSLAPWIDINDEALNTVIKNNFNTFTLSGTCSDSGQTITLTSPLTSSTLCSDSGTWTMTLDLSTLPDATYQFRLEHRTSSGAIIQGLTKDFVKISSSPQALPSPGVPGGYNNSGTVHLSWAPGTDSAGGALVKYQYAIGTSPGATDIQTWTDLSGTSSADVALPSSFTESQAFFISIRGVDIAGNPGGGSTSGPITVDVTAPILGSITASAASSTSTTTTPIFSWNSITDNTGGSGLNRYEYAIGTTAGDASVRAWTTNSLNTSISANGLSLAAGQSYFVSVRAVDNAGNNSNVSSATWAVSAPAGGGGGGTPPVTTLTLTGVSPSAGSRLASTLVTLTGTAFQSGATVTVGGQACSTVNVVSSTTLTCTAPTSLTAGPVTVSVTNPDSTAANKANGFTYLTSPTIALVSPAGGPTTGGFTITISGTDLAVTSSAGSVTVGGAQCSVTAASATSVSCTAPAQAAGVYTLTLVNPDTQSVSMNNAVNYGPSPAISSISPINGLVQGGFPLTISGVNFAVTSSAGGITVGGSPCPLTGSPSATSLTCSAPAKAAGTYSIVVTNPDLQTATIANALTYVTGANAGPAPQIISLTPQTAPRLTTTPITITGNNFQSGATVTIGSSACAAPSVTPPNSLTCTAPISSVSGPFAVTVTNPDFGQGSKSNAFTYLSSPGIATVNPGGGPAEGGFPITINGSDLKVTPTEGTVTIAGSPCEVTGSTSTTVTCTAPPQSEGVYSVTLTNPDGQSITKTNAVNYGPGPVISSISPSTGHISGGFTVQVYGDFFGVTSSTGSVKIGGANCPVTGTPTPNSLTCTAPAHAAGVVDVVVTNPDGQTSTASGAITYSSIIPVTLTGVSPTSGSRLSTTVITISGTGFVSGATVSLGSVACGSVNVASGSSLTCTAPTSVAAGAVNVTVTMPSSATATRAAGFTYLSAPAISTVTPAGGPIAGGFAITLAGSDLLATADAGMVSVSGAPCVVTSSSTTSLTCTAPSKSSGTYAITLTNPDGASTTKASALNYGPGPAIGTLSPITGLTAGGFNVVLTGSNFGVSASAGSVKIGGAPCAITGTPTASSINCVAPARPAGAQDLVITNPDGQTDTLTGAITYSAAAPLVLSTVSPASGSRLSTTALTLTGSGFQSGATVLLGTQACSAVNVVSSTSLTCTAPTSLGTGAVTVTVRNPDQQEANRLAGFTYLSAPGIVSITPNNGPPAGGFTLILSGSDLLVTQDTGTITVGGSACSVTSSSPTEVQCTAPARPAGSYNLVLSNPDGQQTTVTNGVTYNPAPTITSISPSSGYTIGGTGITLTGTGFLQGASVQVGGTSCTGLIVSSSTTATCSTPENTTPGAVNVTFTNADLQSGTLNNGFTYTSTLANSTTSLLTVTAPIAPVASPTPASVALVATPKNADNTLSGVGKTIEVNVASSPAVAGSAIAWVGGAACGTPTATCRRLTDNGNGTYSARVGLLTGTSTLTFTARVVTSGLPDVVFTQTASTNFDNANFTGSYGATITAAGNAPAANGANGPLNLFINAPSLNVTFDNTGADTIPNTATYGHIFVLAGNLVHPAQSTTATKRINIAASSFNMVGGTVALAGLGCPSQANQAPKLDTGEGCGSGNAPTYSSSNHTGGSHGGMAPTISSTTNGSTYGDFRNPKFQGMGATSASVTTYSGGGIFRIQASGACSLAGAANISTDSITAGAGGSVYLNCGAFDTTAFTGNITAIGGAASSTAYSAGGGGRIAIITSGNAETWTGALSFPLSVTRVTAFVAQVSARGGANSGNSLVGGAGTIYLKHAGTPNGALLVHNGNQTPTQNDSGKTILPGLAGTLAGTPGAGSQTAPITLSSTPAIGTAFINAYRGKKIRLNTAADQGTPNDWSDDTLRTITANDATSVTTAETISDVVAGQTFRTIEILDYLEIGKGAGVYSNSDVYVTQGSLSKQGAADALLLNGIFANYLGSGAKLSAGTREIDYDLSGSIHQWSGYTLVGRHLTLSGSANLSIPNLTLTGNLILNTSGTTSLSGGVTAASYTQGGGSVTAPTGITITSGGSATVSGGALVTNSISAKDFNLSGGVVKHEAQTSTVTKRLQINLTGAFNLTGSASIDVTGRGIPGGPDSVQGYIPILSTGEGYTQTNGSIYTASAYCGASHGGLGAGNGTCTTNPTYDDFRNPNLPGASGPYNLYTGGGVVRVTAAGNCKFGNTATIKADGGITSAGAASYNSAGGSIYLNCGSFDSTGYTGSVTANGGNGTATSYSGGGGRIALITTSNASGWVGAIPFPTTTTDVSNFTARVKAQGGTGLGTGGAGTIFLKHAAAPNGALLISNGGNGSASVGDGKTVLIGLSGTLSSTPGTGSKLANVTPNPSSSPGVPTGFANAYKGMKVRLNVDYTNGTASDWSDDNLTTIASHDAVSITTNEVITNATSGNTFRTIEVLDFLEVTAGATVLTNSDLYVSQGSLSGLGGGDSVTLSGFIAALPGGAGLKSPTKSFDYSIGGSPSFYLNGGTILGRHLTWTSSGSLTGGGINLGTAGNLTLNGAGTITFTGGITAGAVSIGSGTITAPTGIAGTSYTQGGGSVTSPTGITISSGGNATVSGGTLVTNSISAKDFNLSGGVVKHEAQTSTVTKRLQINLTGAFNLTGSASIDVTGRGLPGGPDAGQGYIPSLSTGEGYTQTNGSIYTASAYCGASHGGLGAGNGTCKANPTYGDFRNPNLPGASGPYNLYTGGGVVRVTAAGNCKFGNTATIKADGGITSAGAASYNSAGGSIYLNCGSFDSTGYTGSVTANGGNGNATSYSGGGGRIALITTSNASGWVGAIPFPTTTTDVSNFTARVKAQGGTGLGTGGAGTIFLKHAAAPNGALLISNGGNSTAGANDGKTVLIGISGTLSATPGVGSKLAAITPSPSSSPGIPTGFSNAYKGMKLRLNTAFTNNTLNDWSDDNLTTIASHDAVSINTQEVITDAAAGNTFRTIEIVDYLEVTPGSTLLSNSDLFVTTGSLSNQGLADSITLNGVTAGAGGGATIGTPTKYFDYLLGGTTGYSLNGTSLAARNLEITSSGNVTGGNINLGSSGTFTKTGTGTLTLSGGVTAGAVSFTGGTVSLGTGISASSYTQGNASVTAPSGITVTSGGNASISAGTLVTNSITAKDLNLSGGVVKHEAQTSTVTKRLQINLTGAFNLTGTGSIDLTGRGSPGAANTTQGYMPNLSTGEGYTQTNGSTYVSAYCGASHGGVGASNGSCDPNPVYDDFRNPNLPGAGSNHPDYVGGGVVRVTAAGTCKLGNTATIKADGGVTSAGVASYTSAGGSVYLNCSGFDSTGYTGTISANGGNGLSTSYAGGGGRIALISTGPSTGWTGAFNFPASASDVTNFTARVKAQGGTGVRVGGAGTIYLKHSNLPNGALLLSNGSNVQTSNNDGQTILVGVSGALATDPTGTKVLSISGSALPALGNSGWTNAFKGQKIRPNTAYTNGTATDWSDDNVLTIASNDVVSITTQETIANASLGSTFRTLEILDRLEIVSGTNAVTYSDLYITQGSLSGQGSADSITLNGVITGFGSATLGSGTKFVDFALSGAKNYFALSRTLKGRNLANDSTGSFLLEAMDLKNGSNYTQTGAGTVIVNTISADNFTLTGGVVTHDNQAANAAPYAYTKRLVLNLTNNFSISGSASSGLDVSGRGAYGGTFPDLSDGEGHLTTLAPTYITQYCGGSHGGQGATNGTCFQPPTYDDFRNPNLPGSGGAHTSQLGGGVVRVTAGGSCTFAGSAVINANATSTANSGAGGSVFMQCGSFQSTGYTGTISANGGAGAGSSRAGGGGRIALISTGNASAWTGNIPFPALNADLATFTSRVKAVGGTGLGTGGAGTIYLKHSGTPNGALLVSNGSNSQTSENDGSTVLRGLAGTLVTTPSAGAKTVQLNVTSLPSLATGYTNAYKGLKVRLDTSYTNGTPSIWSDDNLLTIASNDLSSLTTEESITNTSAGKSFRTIEVLDFLEIMPGAGVATNSDVFITTGTLSGQGATDSITLNGLIAAFSGGASVGTPTKAFDFDLSGSASAYLGSADVTGRNLTFTSSGTINAGAVNLGSTGALVLNGAGTLSLSGNVTSGSVNIVAGTLAASAGSSMGITTNSYTQSGGALSITNALTVINNGDASISGGTTTTNGLNARNLTVTGGTIAHETPAASTSTTVTKRLNVNLSGNFSISNSAAIDVTGRGAYGSTFPILSTGEGQSTTLAATQLTNYCGGSHGGLGATNGSCFQPPTYDDFRDPNLPGAGGAHTSQLGGGVVRITAAGSCNITGNAKIDASATSAANSGAGGSVLLNCASLETTGYSGLIQANGGGGGGSSHAGGGGRIAIITSGNASSWTGAIAFPSTSGDIANLTARVKARGGTNLGTGGAGTIFLKHAGAPNGALVISNGTFSTAAATDGKTHLNGISGTIASTPGTGDSVVKVVSGSAPALTVNYTNAYKGKKVRLNTSNTSVGSSPLGGDIYTLTGNTTSGGEYFLNVDRTISNVSASNTFRTLEVLDYLHLDPGVSVTSNSDLYVTQGALGDPFNATAIKLFGALVTAPNAGAAFYSATGKSFDFELTGSFGYPSDLSTLVGRHLTINLSPSTTTVTLGSINLGTTGDLTVSSGNFVATNGITARSVTVSGSNNLTTKDITLGGGDLTLNTTGTVIANNITGGRHFSMSAGTLKHEAQPTAGTNVGYRKLAMDLSGDFTMTGGSIDVSSLGYAAGVTYAYAYNNNPTLITEGSRTNATASTQGGSHGGRGGGLLVAGTAAFDSYDDYRNPTLPGSGSVTASAGGGGGGVVRISAPSGTCSLANGATIKANAATGTSYGGAGGTIYLNCGTIFAQNTWSTGGCSVGGSGCIQANGTAGTSTTRGGGGGGRIALISGGNATSWGYTLPYPSTSSYLTTFKGLVQARGGVGVSVSGGGAGTIYVRNSASSFGDLLIDNGSNAIVGSYTGQTELVGTTANSNVLTTVINPYDVQIAAAGTPLQYRSGAFRNHLLAFFTLNTTTFNPGGAGRTEVLINNNSETDFITANPSSFTGADGLAYRIVYRIDSLDVAGNAQVNFAGADLRLTDCDIHSNNLATFDVPSGSTISGINAMYSATCSVPSAQRVGGATPRVTYSTTGPSGINGYFFQ